MPRVTQYIRDEDIAIWNRIKNKSEWIHEHLSHGQLKGAALSLEPGKSGVKVIDYQTDLIKEQARQVVTTFTKDDIVKLCKVHGTPLDNRGKCLQKGCKYA